MTIRIDEIAVRNLGPVRQFEHALGKINLIYGHNEKGKTLLVEFIIRSLFKHTKMWPLREIQGEGTVTVSGLEEKPTQMRPKSAKKLEDFWDDAHAEFPQDISKLLVVRAAEVELTNKKPCGIDKQILLEYLSGKGVSDAIQDKLAGVLKNASLEDGVIVGAREQGIKKDLSHIDEEIARVEGKFEKVNAMYSQGKLQELRTNEGVLLNKFDALRRAKQHAAFTCQQKIHATREQLSQYPQDTLDAIREGITRLTAKKRDAERTEGEYTHAKQHSAHYGWLKQAVEQYEKRESLALPKYNLIWLALSGMCLTALLVLMSVYGYSLRTDYWLWALIAGMVGGAGVYIINQNKLLRHRDAFEDIQDIKQAYKEKFGMALSGLSGLKAALDEISAQYYSAQALQTSLEHMQKEMVETETDIINNFLAVERKKTAVADFESAYADMKARRKELEDTIGRLATQLEVLDVEPQDFLEEGTDTKYSKAAYEETRLMLEHAREQMRTEEDNLTALKQTLCAETGNEINADWDVILDALRGKRSTLFETRQALKADIIAQILVNKALDIYRAKEDEKIRAGLQSEKLVKALQQMTGRYSKIEMAGDELIVADKYTQYPFSDLSSGTQEQIFLALRIGFAAKISGNDSLFFILDDAFQYSDWERRELLVDKMIDLARHDWQVIYFSMDDHIRELFVKKAGKAFKDDFKLISIDET